MNTQDPFFSFVTAFPSGKPIENGGITESSHIEFGGAGPFKALFEVLDNDEVVAAGTYNESNAFVRRLEGLTAGLHHLKLREHASASPTSEWRLTVLTQSVTLAFDAQNYPLAPGGRFDAIITLNEGSGGVPGAIIQVTLPLGFTFSDGSNGTRPFTTDSNGQVRIAIKAGVVTGAHTLYATHASQTATAVATVTREALGQLSIPFAYKIAISRDGTTAYVVGYSQAGSYGAVTAFDTATHKIIASQLLGIHTFDIAVSADPRYVYVTRSGVGAVAKTLIQLDARTLTVTGEVHFQDFNPAGIAFSPDGAIAYLAGNNSTPGFPNGRLAVVDIERLSLLHTLVMQRNTYGIATSPDGRHVYVANANGDGTALGTVTVVATSNLTVQAHIDVGSNPHGIAVSPDNSRVYSVVVVDKALQVIDARTNGIINTVQLGLGAWDLALSNDGHYLLASETNNGQTVVIIDTRDFSVRSIPTGPSPIGVAFSPDGNCAYICNLTTNTVTVMGI
jgi:YVTN family beta-propeller protein